MTRITQLLTLGMALLIGIPCLGVDLIGPFNNTQTVVEYTTFGTTTVFRQRIWHKRVGSITV